MQSQRRQKMEMDDHHRHILSAKTEQQIQMALVQSETGLLQIIKCGSYRILNRVNMVKDIALKIATLHWQINIEQPKLIHHSG